MEVASKRVEVGVGQAPRPAAEQSAGRGGASPAPGSRWLSQPAGGIEPSLPSGQAGTLISDTPVRSVVAKGTGPKDSPALSASGQAHRGCEPGTFVQEEFDMSPQKSQAPDRLAPVRLAEEKTAPSR